MTRELVPPGIVDGALVRLVTDEVTVWVERWAGDEWVRDTTTSVAEVMKAPPASPRSLSLYGFSTP